MTRLCRIPLSSRPSMSAGALLAAGTLAAGMLTAGMPAAGMPAALAAGKPAVGKSVASAASGTGWQLVRDTHYGPPKNESGYDVVLAHSSDAWFFGGTNLKRTGRPIVERWINHGWRRPVLPAGLTSWIVAASAASPKNIWAVSHLGGYVLNWALGKWATVPSWTPLPGRQFTGITAITKKNVWVFGASSGTTPGTGTWHFSGGTWTKVSGIAGDIYRASDLGATSIWAIGGVSGSRNAVEHFDGTKWSQVTAKALARMRFTAVLALTSHSVWVAGRARQKGRERPKLVHWNGRHWVRIAVPGRAIPSKISSDGHGGVWVVTNSARGSWVRHRSLRGRWRSTKIGTGPATEISALAVVPGTTALWGGGRIKAGTGTNAAIFSHGKIS